MLYMQLIVEVGQRVQQEQLVHKVLRVLQGLKAPPVHKVYRAQQVPTAQMALQALTAPMELTAQMVQPELMDKTD